MQGTERDFKPESGQKAAAYPGRGTATACSKLHGGMFLFDPFTQERAA
jgi:hypothetical protein